MNPFTRYTLFDKCMPILLSLFATASIGFGLCWSVHASLLLHG